MPSTIKPLDPDMRQRLSAALTGDAKPGSLREHLVRGLIGSSVGDDQGLVGYTPLGMAFSASAANRDRRLGGSGAGHTLEAAAGMIPGPGKKLAPELLEGAADLFRTHAGDVERVVKDLVANGFHPAEAKAAVAQVGPELSRTPKLNRAHDAMADSRLSNLKGEMDDDATLHSFRKDDKTSVRQQLEQASKPSPEELANVRHRADIEAGQEGANIHDKVGVANVRKAADQEAQDDLHLIAGSDPDKLNFIRNAMDDEGGNSPEEVASILVDHLQKYPEKYEAIAKQYGSEAMEYPEKLHDELYNNLSIPEMLAMHYDLDPKTMSKAYSAKGGSQVTPRGKPTQ